MTGFDSERWRPRDGEGTDSVGGKIFSLLTTGGVPADVANDLLNAHRSEGPHTGGRIVSRLLRRIEKLRKALEAAQRSLEAIATYPNALEDKGFRDLDNARGYARSRANVAKQALTEDGLAPMREDMLCERRCVHGSPCKLARDHVAPHRHETEHGCIFYDDPPRGIAGAYCEVGNECGRVGCPECQQ